jgi:hypothetical protein
MKNLTTHVSNVLSGLSLFVSIQDLESVINIILLIVSIVILLINFGLRIYDRFKDDNKFDKQDLIDTLKDAKDTAEQIKDTIEQPKDTIEQPKDTIEQQNRS